MRKLKTISGRNFKDAYLTSNTKIAFFSRSLINEPNLITIKNTLSLDDNLMKRLEKLKEKSEKKGSSYVSAYLIELEEGSIKFNENELEHMELLINIWDDYNMLTKTYSILINECVDLLEKINDEQSSKKIGGFFNKFNNMFKKDMEIIELSKMKKIIIEGKEIINSEQHKVKKSLVNIGEDSKDTSIFSFLRSQIVFLLELKDAIIEKKEYNQNIDIISVIIENWKS